MRTRLSSWQIKTREENDQMKYVESKYETVAHLASDTVTYQVDFPADAQGFNIKSVKVSSLENNLFNVTILDIDTNDVIYQSVDETKYHYDNVDLVYKPNTKAFLVRIHNKGIITTKFTVEIKGIEVR